jgi:glycosyltransferase A (GT-A) superfamily protein (DUF2064 family)
LAWVLIMAKAPIPGTVKTRLGLPPQDGARLQEALIKDTVSKARPLGPTTVAGAPPERLDPIRRLLPEDAALIPESGGDLGGRMQAAAAALFERSFEPVLISARTPRRSRRDASGRRPGPSTPTTPLSSRAPMAAT